ncbi:OpgC domain-containing protein [Enterovirga sp.]|uniref:OpgC family protein n=1 Tax=Enterovirga sp. TaxID=2026350 RepID=UPI002C6D74DC|nr:OpgC domain-containing protein [Enterovirga sp.]HMO29138.1 OpgC domain-containing protein [Enterovirga sp.]
MRAANEIDFWRGLALVSIFINHIPGFFFERLTHRNYGLSDSAELFVFLAGWSLRLLASGTSRSAGLLPLVLRLGARAVTLYAAQILITMLAIAIIAGFALWLDNPLLLEWHNAAAVFQEPVRTHLGLVLLTHQLGYFDILPLYVVLMAAGPLIAIVHRLAPAALLPLSLLLYGITLTFRLDLPTWPVDGIWFFNPLAWQLVFVLGFLLARPDGLGAAARRHLPWLRPLAWGAVIVLLAVAIRGWEPDPTRVPEPKLFFIFDKTHLSPARLLHFLALVAAFAGSYRLIARFASRPARFLAMLGRNSLNVFCVGSLLSLIGQFLRVASAGSFWVDLCVLGMGVAVLGITAWLSELRDRVRVSADRASAPSSA